MKKKENAAEIERAKTAASEWAWWVVGGGWVVVTMATGDSPAYEGWVGGAHVLLG